ncbi:MAG: RluA family pseudouridine synthase [Burkholderiales bacterium]|nr:RluA family pseudouridine synthase [Burkholderiales bacterium]
MATHQGPVWPSKDGVSASSVGLPVGPWSTLLDFLTQRFPAIAREEWTARMQRGDVVDARGMPLRPDQPYQAHGKVHYYRSLPPEPHIPFEAVLLYQDEHIVAVDKPHFLPVTPGGRYLQETLLVRLKRQLGNDQLVPMHRLDRDTAGVVLFTCQPLLRDRYHALFRQRLVSKHYEAIAPWRADLALPTVHQSRLVAGASFLTMQEAGGEPNAETSIDVIEVKGDLARYSLRPVTGQKHQLRVHMAALGVPILNDRMYPHLHPDAAPDYTRPLQLLARSIAFLDPVTGQARHFASQRQLDW